MASSDLTLQVRASWVDEAIDRVVREEGLDLADPFVAKIVARIRADLDQAVIRIVIREPEVPS